MRSWYRYAPRRMAQVAGGLLIAALAFGCNGAQQAALGPPTEPPGVPPDTTSPLPPPDTLGVPPDTTPPPPPNGSTPHEPAGYLPFAVFGGSAVPLYPRASLNLAVGSWYAYPQGNPNLMLATDASAPTSPATVIRTRFPRGEQAGTGPVDWGGWDILGSGPAGQKRKVYLALWIKIVGASYENQASGTKVGFLAVGRDQSQGQNEGFFFLHNNQGQQGISSSFSMEFRQQGIPQPGGQVTRNLNPNITSRALMTCGVWHRWEAVLELNTMGRADGVFRMWVDGVQTHNYTDVVYVTPSTPNGFNLFKWNPTWGGSGGTRTRDDLMDIDQVYLSGVP